MVIATPSTATAHLAIVAALFSGSDITYASVFFFTVLCDLDATLYVPNVPVFVNLFPCSLKVQ